MSVEYQIIYSKRKTISIIVERDRKIVVRAPLNTKEEVIKREIEKRKRLLLAKINHNQKYPVSDASKEFVPGESLLYLGRNYKLYVAEDISDVIKFESKFIISKENQKNANKLFKEWYIAAANKIIIPKAKDIARQIGVSYNSINVTEMKYRWGSCTPKDNIHFNWRLIKAPITVIEYIIVHELTHLLEANHSQEFWNRVAAQLPNYSKAKDWLKEYGYELEKDF